MDALILIAVVALVYAMARQSKSNTITSTEDYPPTTNEVATYTRPPPGYNPFILNQFQEMKDRIFSADLRENRIETKPSINATGTFGITENQIKFHPSDSITIVYGPKHTLNI